jgi:hypothetical protein
MEEGRARKREREREEGERVKEEKREEGKERQRRRTARSDVSGTLTPTGTDEQGPGGSRSDPTKYETP